MIRRDDKLQAYISDPTEDEMREYKNSKNELMKKLIDEYDFLGSDILDGSEFGKLPDKFKNIQREYKLSRENYIKYLQIANDSCNKGIHNQYTFLAFSSSFYIFKFGDSKDILCSIGIRTGTNNLKTDTILEEFYKDEDYRIDISSTHVGLYCKLTDLSTSKEYDLSEW